MSLDRSELKRPDEFVATGRSWMESLASHSSQVWVGVGVLAVVLGGLAAFLNHRENRRIAAADAYYGAQEQLAQELRAFAQPGSAVKLPVNIDETFGKSVAALKDVVTLYSGTPSAYEAVLALGALYQRHGDSVKAITWYDKAVAASAPGFERAAALRGLGYAYENSSQCTKAATYYEQALKQGDEALKGDLLLALARCQEPENNSTNARATYERVIKEFPQTPYERAAKAALQFLKK